MAQPRAYSQTTTFNDFTVTNPSDPHSGSNLDSEFVEIKQNTDDLNTNIALIQRDDGKLKNEAVHKDAFDQDSLALIGLSGYTLKGAWAATTAYVVGDLATNNDATYVATTAHTSGATFSSTNWILIANSAIETTGASVNTHNGTGTQTVFATTFDYAAVTDIQVFVAGALVATNLYTVGTNIITFTSPPASGTNNVIIWGDSVVSQNAKAATLTYRDTTNNHKTTASRWATLTTDSVTDAETSADSSEYSAKAYAVGGTEVTGATDKGAAKDWAIGADEVMAARPDGAEYSAKEYATGTTAPLGSAKSWSTKDTTAVASSLFSAKEYASGTSATGGTSKEWATKDDGEVISGVHSSKAHASVVGSNAPTDGSAKEWATVTGSAVASSEFSAKEYAQGTAATGGTSKEWATNAGSAEVHGGAGYSSKAYSQDTANDIGSSKDWAIKTSAIVDSADYSSKEWAAGQLGANTNGSAKQWSLGGGNFIEATAVTGSSYSAKRYASLAAADVVLTNADVVTAASSVTAAANSAAAVSRVYDSFNDVYLGSMRTDKTVADAVTLTGASWAKDSSSIAFTGTSGTVTIGQELTTTATGYPLEANIIGTQLTTPIVISNPFTVAGTGVTLVFVGSGVNGAFNSSTGGPAANNDGDALVQGNLYFNPQVNEMRIYDGSNWIAATAVGQTSLVEYKYVTNANQVDSGHSAYKTYIGVDAGGSATLSYTQDNIIVFMNGVQLKDTTDYVATNGSSVVLVAAPVLNDEIAIIAFKSFTTADMVSKSAGGTFAGAVTFGSTINGTEIVAPATNNLGVGIDALDSITTGDRNTAFGDNALTAMTTGSEHTAVGYNALKSLSVAVSHPQTAFGAYALEDAAGSVDADVQQNTAIGFKACQQLTTGDANTAVGFQALSVATTSRYNVAVGATALGSDVCLATGNNTAIGYGAMAYSTTGHHNTCIGYGAGGAYFGNGISTGDYNIIIGADVQPVLPAGDNQINIGNTIYGDTSTGDIWTKTTGKIKQKGAFMQNSVHQSWVMGG